MVGGNNLVHLETDYIPTLDELDRLDSWQRNLSMWKAELRAEWDKCHFNYHQRMISKERFHQGIRARLRLINTDIVQSEKVS